MRAAVGRMHRLGARAHVPLDPRGTHDPVSDIEPLPAVQRRVHRVAHALPIIRVRALQEVVKAARAGPETVDGAGRVRQGQGHVAQVHFPEAELADGLAGLRRII